MVSPKVKNIQTIGVLHTEPLVTGPCVLVKGINEGSVPADEVQTGHS